MKRGVLIMGFLTLFIFLTGCYPKPEVSVPAPSDFSTRKDIIVSNPIVKITSSGFEPKALTVKAGTTVTFVNEDSNKHWPASAVHPTHEAYPGSSIKKCDTVDVMHQNFDACKGLAQGESFSFNFNEKGSWKYHDHLRTSSTGTIMVE